MAVGRGLGHRSCLVERGCLADSGWRMRTLQEPSWSVDSVMSMVPVVEVLLAGCNSRSRVGQADAEGIGSCVLGCVAMMTSVPARGIAQFGIGAVADEEAEYTHVRDSVSSHTLDRHNLDRCIATPKMISRVVAGRVGFRVD